MPDDLLMDTPADGPFAEVLAEILQAEERGQAPDLDRFVADFPDLESRLRAYFRNREGFERLAAQLAPTPHDRGAGDSTTPHDASAPPLAVLKPGMRFGGYEILEELGRGGMGVVYKARQFTPERLVALKVIRTDRLEGLSVQERRQWIDRFHREAQLVAGLEQHPHIVTLYEVGDHEGQPYFTMQLVAGGSLAQRLRPSPLTLPSPLPGGEGRVRGGAAAADRRVQGQRDNARLLAEAARAVDYAHRRGVLHRDLKPGNILLDAEGRPLVGDFGLARRLDETGSLVASGIEGTAAYMAPEQARAAKGAMTTAADVYSLGAILYETLTGRPPFRGENDFETLLSVMNDEPAHPRALDRRLSRDLATVCLKCLEKEPSRRYRSAAALAEDLDNWREGRPINARPVGAAGRLWRWCRRNPVPAVAAAAVLVIAVTAFGLVLDSRGQAVTAASAATAAKVDALNTAGENAELARQKGVLAQQEMEQRREVQRKLARLAVQEGLNLCENQGDVARGLPCLAYGLQMAETSDAPELAHAVRANLGAWRGSLLSQRAVLVHENSPEIHQAAFSPDGRIVATACGDGAIRLWDAITGTPLGEPLGAVQRQAALPSPLGSPEIEAPDALGMLAPDEDPAYAVAFSPDGRWIAGGSLRGRVRVWEVRGGRLLKDLQHHDGSGDKAFRTSLGTVYGNDGIVALSFRPDGRALMAAGQSGLIRLWDPATGEKLADLPHPGSIQAALFSPDGQSLLVGCQLGNRQGAAFVWDSVTGKPRYEPLPLTGDVSSVAFSPDGRWFATGGGKYQIGQIGEARLWETATGKPVGAPSRFDAPVQVVAFSPDGRTWLAATSAGAVRLLDRETGQRFEGHIRPISETGGGFGKGLTITAAAFSPDGRTFVTAGDGVQAWETRGTMIGEPIKLHRSPVHTVAFSSDGRTLLTAASDGTVRLWETPTSRPPPGRTLTLSTSVAKLAFSPDGRRLLVGTRGRAALLCDLASRELPIDLAHSGPMVSAVDVSRDGRFALTGSYDGTARLWDGTTGKMLGQLSGPEPIAAVAFSPDGRTAAIAALAMSRADGGAAIAIGREIGGVRLCDVPSLKPRENRFLPGASVAAIAFSPDGKTLAVAHGGRVHRLKVADGSPVGSPLEHGAKVEIVAFSPDGALVLTAGPSRVARLWDAATGKGLHELSHRDKITAATFSADGQTVLTAGMDGVAQLWRTADGKPAGPPLVHLLAVTAAALSPDGRTVLTGCLDGTVRLWDAPAALPLGPLMHQGAAVRCAAFSPDGGTAVWGGDATTLDFRDTPPLVAGPPDRVRLWAEALTGYTHDADQAVRWLAPDRWRQAFDSVRDLVDKPSGAEGAVAWHRREAEECELTAQWFPAQWHLQRLLEEQPDDGPLLRRRGLALAHLGQWERASELLTNAIAHGEDTAEVRLHLGNAFSQLSDLDRAEKTFTEGIQRHRDDWTLLQARGSLRAEEGHWREAAKDLGRAAAAPNAPVVVGSQKALACLRADDLPGYREACTALLDRLERSRSPQESVPEAADVLWTCCLDPASGADPARVLPLAERAARSGPGTGMEYYPLVRALGASLYRSGKYDEAVQVLGKAATLNNQAPTVWLLLAMTYHRQGNATEARRALDAARSWMAQSHQEERLAHRVGWAVGIAAGPGGFDPVGAMEAFAGLPLGEVGTGNASVRQWRQLPWPEQVALQSLRYQAENLIAKGPVKP